MVVCSLFMYIETGSETVTKLFGLEIHMWIYSRIQIISDFQNQTAIVASIAASTQNDYDYFCSNYYYYYYGSCLWIFAPNEMGKFAFQINLLNVIKTVVVAWVLTRLSIAFSVALVCHIFGVAWLFKYINTHSQPAASHVHHAYEIRNRV